MAESIKKEWINFGWLLLYLTITSIIAYFGFLALRAIEIPGVERSLIIYGGQLAFGIFGILAFVIFKVYKGKLAGISVHTPERGLFGKTLLSKGIPMIFLSVLFFSVLLFSATLAQVALPSIPFILEQEAAVLGDVISNVYIASTAETASFYVLWLLILNLLFLFVVNKGKGKVFYFLLAFIANFFYALAAVIYHGVRYGADQTALMAVYIFWWIHGILLVVTGSVIPGFILHDLNNLFVRLGQLFSNQAITIVVGSLLIVWLVATVFVIMKLRKKK